MVKIGKMSISMPLVTGIILICLQWSFYVMPCSTRPLIFSKRTISSLISLTDYEETLLWAVKLRKPYWGFVSNFSDAFKQLTNDISLVLLHQIGDIDAHYLFAYQPPEHQGAVNYSVGFFHKKHLDLHKDLFRKTQEIVELKLDKHHYVESYSREIIRKRHKRWEVRFSDEEFPNQWHLNNPKNPEMDIDVMRVWKHNVTGKNIVVAVVDDGVEWTNPDLEKNYCAKGSWDLNDNDPDPMPSTSSDTNHHGTRCAGEIAAVPNKVCAVGVAYGAKVSGLRVLDGPLTDGLEATAFNKNMQINDIYSCSWGPDDDGMTVDGPHTLALQAMKHGIDYGRNGYGSIYVVASGNGGSNFDNCNYDGYANSIYTVTIGAVDEYGHMPYYAENCAAMLAVTFSSGGNNARSIVTTDWSKNTGDGCTSDHTGTSAAAPIAAGLIALLLEVQPCLTWRDVQHLIILSAVSVDADAKWITNAAGLRHSHRHGFGLMKAWHLVNAAKVWKIVPWLTEYETEIITLNKPIPKDDWSVSAYEVTKKDLQGYVLNVLEHVLVTVNITHHFRGQLDIQLLCPSGTHSMIAPPRASDKSDRGLKGWWFSTVRCWGESPIGTWKLLIKDINTSDKRFGIINYWKLKLYGSPMMPEEFQDRRKEVLSAISNSVIQNKKPALCQTLPKHGKDIIPISERVLKILAATNIFLVFLTLYQMFEYIVCYKDEKKEQKEVLQQQMQAHRIQQYATADNDGIVESERLLQDQDSRSSPAAFDSSESIKNMSENVSLDLTSEQLQLNSHFESYELTNSQMQDNVDSENDPIEIQESSLMT
ncbi:convertase subtilisin kexin type 7-like [Octopus vulgaris]|uniref:Convertase subtilisin kexin type 7-like n=2 Tax=Octopus vulgaris TaxID=6645 RepID=A0AA36AVQ7_OCTVU|nr:convertase subtilisin kexin type 7-like [Octopus vulgaris]